MLKLNISARTLVISQVFFVFAMIAQTVFFYFEGLSVEQSAREARFSALASQAQHVAGVTELYRVKYNADPSSVTALVEDGLMIDELSYQGETWTFERAADGRVYQVTLKLKNEIDCTGAQSLNLVSCGYTADSDYPATLHHRLYM
ncbi:hypothetical protein [Neptuniibacter sp. QD37_11]|uniref:hypothetical protein n=1 Tax=Neptuniibacter sp. QD37_11 TaxID=3398209 RepID=UPI0039F5274E